MIHYIHLRTSAQATEDPEKVRSALKLLLPPPGQSAKKDTTSVHETVTTGYHGNPIILMEAELKQKKDCQHVVDRIREHMGPAGISRLASELPQRVDYDCNLYIRFNKQEAYLGKLMTTTRSDSIRVRIKIKAYPARPDKAIQVARSLLGEGD
jgi:RNA binding exosome subunit